MADDFKPGLEGVIAFESHLEHKQIIDVLEATQFIRMLPFKCAAGDFEKAKFFYVHACHLLSKIF